MTANNSIDLFEHIQNRNVYKSPEVCHFSRRCCCCDCGLFFNGKDDAFYTLPYRTEALLHIFCCVWDGIKLEEECNFPII